MITSDRGFIIATPTKCGTTTLEEMCRRHRGGRAHPGLPSFRIMDWESPRRQHRMALPEGRRVWRAEGKWWDADWGNADRYLMVRSPYARYCSMYEYLRAPHNYSKFGAREIQGREWRGTAIGRVGLKHKPLSFEAFLYFIAEQREVYNDRRWRRRRGDLLEPFAYRSPWVWLDPLDRSLSLLREQPGAGGENVRVIWLEDFWPSMARLKDMYGLDTLSVRATIQANKTLTYTDSVAGMWARVGKGAKKAIGVQYEFACIERVPAIYQCK